MVSFRYHVVSLAAVLFGLAAGVVLGAGPLSSRVDSALGGSTATAAPSAAASPSAAGYDQAYVDATAGRLVTGKLAGVRVVVVTTPGTPTPLSRDVTAALTAAGATISGQVDLTTAWTDPGQATVLAQIASRLAPADAQIPPTATEAEQTAAAFAAAVVTKSSSAVGRPSQTATALLAGLTAGGFVTTTGTPANRAAAAVLLSPAKVTTEAAPSLLPLGPALSAAAGGGVVLGGPTGSAAPSGLVGRVRADATARAAVSTADVVDLTSGRVALVLALEQARTGKHGAYGAGPGADAPVPPAQ